VELECLKLTEEGYEWKEQARWIKLEEDIEVGSGRWSKPYLPSTAYHHIHRFKELLTNNTHFILDINVENLDDIATLVCQNLVTNKMIGTEFSAVLKATLLARHHHKNRSHQQKQQENHLHCHQERMPRIIRSFTANHNIVNVLVDDKHVGMVSFLEDSLDDLTHSRRESADSVQRYMSPNATASTILVANVPYIEQPLLIFVRLEEARKLGNLNEISLPVQALFLLLAPEESREEAFQVGRTIGILLSDESFWSLVNECQLPSDIISGIEAFLLNSSLLHHGEWTPQVINQSVNKWVEANKNRDTKAVLRRRTTTMCATVADTEIGKPVRDSDPLVRTGRIFGCLVQDVKRKLPHVRSDFTDAFNARCLITVVLIYFSFMAPAITFAALMSKETNGLLGVSEMIAATSVSGVIFGLFSGQPLIILGATGPLLVMEEKIYNLCQSLQIEFLPYRVWIGFWITIFCTLIVALDLSYLVRKFTLFTEEVVTALISTVFIYESVRYIWLNFSTYYFPNLTLTPTSIIDQTFLNTTIENGTMYNTTHVNSSNIVLGNNTIIQNGIDKRFEVAMPFLITILMMGTFLLCYYIRRLRHSIFFPAKLRRLVSDFGIALAVLTFVAADWLLDDRFTPKLDIPDGLTPTSPSQRNWMIEFLDKDKMLSPLQIVGASVPALLVTIILFMETELTGTIVDRKEYKLKKGSGYNLDLLIVGLLATFCSLFGLPWMCACPVHSISHLNSLTIWNPHTPPGTRPQVESVIEQRVTNILIHILIGFSVLLAPILRLIPIAVLYGVFLYLGITALSHLRFVERIKLLFVASSNHPDHRYIRKVKTRKIHFFTLIQIVCLIIVLVVKSSLLAPTFPFFIVLMVPLRSQLNHTFTKEELEELDTDIMDDIVDEDLDEYDIVHVPM